MARRKSRRTKKWKTKFRFKFKFSKKQFHQSVLAVAALGVLGVVMFQPVKKEVVKTPAVKSASVKMVSKPKVLPQKTKASTYFPKYRSTPVRVEAPTLRMMRYGAPKITIVIDDIGHTTEYTHELLRLGNKVTYAILPFLKYSTIFDRLSLQTGAEVILHLPLESISGTIPGPGLILNDMNDEDLTDHLRRNLASVPNAVGANNHMGSKGSADYRVMSLILNELQIRGMIYLDSMTTAQSVASSVARDLTYPILKRDVFLDNTDNQEAIRDQVNRLASLSRQRGYAIGIGHYRFNTLRVLLDEIPLLEQEGFDIVSLREMRSLKISR